MVFGFGFGGGLLGVLCSIWSFSWVLFILFLAILVLAAVVRRFEFTVPW